jgi:phenylpyruvate tautomerase PptA (4-oxalocrotonate tautomerase family)
MPLWKVYHPVGAYSAEDKKKFAERLTEMYARIPIPKFYVVMIFEEVTADSIYVGGEPHDKFVRFKVDHMARTLPSPILREWWVKAVDQLIAPFVRERGYDWEVHHRRVAGRSLVAAGRNSASVRVPRRKAMGQGE